MDLRGSAWFPERGELYLAGGMEASQTVSAALIRYNISTLSVFEPDVTDLLIYPNPAQDRVWIETSSPGRIEIYGIDGSLFRSVVVQSKQSVEIRSGFNLVQFHGDSEIIQQIIIGQ